MNFLQIVCRSQVLRRTKHLEILSIQVNAYSTTNLVNNPSSRRKCNTNLNLTQQSSFVHSITALQNKEPKPSLFKRILKTMGITSVSEAKIRVNGYNLYEAVVDKLDYEYWIKENKMEDTFMSWFLVTELHVWMLLIRCMMESDDGKTMRNSTIEALWTDVGIRSVKYHPGSRSLVRQQIQLLSQEFQAALVSYDEGLMTNDIVLAGAVWRRFFLKNNDDPVLIENIVRYIRKQVYELDKMPKEEFFKNPDIKWIPLTEGRK